MAKMAHDVKEWGLRMDVLAAAVQWWESKRPVKYSEAEHLRNPSVNCSGHQEIALARAVAKMRSGT